VIPTPSSIGTTIRSVRRARQILTTLVQFGFREVVEEFGLASILGRGSKLTHSEHSDTGRLTEAQRVRRVLEELGPTFAKVGQVLSTRSDLVPEEWAAELRHLQAGIAPVPWAEIEPQLASEFGPGWEKLFTSIEHEPLAAASMAQVHRAVLADGTRVVLKILRPGIQKIIEADMEILRALAGLLEPRLESAGYSATAVVEQFAREIVRETDLVREGRSTERMGRDFADDERIVFPRVFWEATTRRVLALEEIHGQLVTQLDPETLTREERHAFVAAGADAVFRQCLVIGFFHADPHPGNLFHLPDNRIAFIDCGMTGYADPRTVAQLADLVLGAVNGDLDRVLDAALNLAEADKHLADDRGFRAEVWRFIDHFRGGALSDLRMGVLLQEFFELLRRFHLQCPPDMVHLIKAITTIEGVAEQVAPDFDVIDHVRPYIERLVRDRAGLRAIRRRVERTSLAWAELAETAPRDLRSLLDAARSRDLGLRLEHQGLQELERTIASAATTIGFSVVIAAMVIGGAVLVLADMMNRSQSILTLVAIGAFIAAGILGVLRLVGDRLRQPRGGSDS
jgi:ubiquinone biosynthesis protein